jgi:hypothetical protein
LPNVLQILAMSQFIKFQYDTEVYVLFGELLQ